MVSIVIIVKNDRGIDKTLASIYEQETTYDYEVLVVDASGDRLLDIKNKYPQTQWVYYPGKKDKKYTIPEQRNIGINLASGEIVVFIDASCVAEKTWLQQLVCPLIAENESITAGRVKSEGKDTLNDLTAVNNSNRKYLDECPTINLAFKKILIDQVGNFDENFNYGSDVDFSWRVIDAGYKVRYVSNALITHDWGTVKHEIKRNLLYGQARARLYLKHKNKIPRIISKDQVLLVYPLFLLGLPLTLLIPWYPLILVFLVLKNINQPKPVELVFSHLVYGVGVLAEIFKIDL